MKKKAVILLSIFISVILLVTLIVLVIIRIESKKYNLTDINSIENISKTEVVEDSYIELTDITMHYLKFGNAGEPLILLHGNGGSCETLYEMATYLGNNYQVYLIESRCHGMSSKTDTITYELMAKDTYEFITKMNLINPIFVGHSDGAMVGISLASLYPDSIKTLISCGANSNPKAFKLYFKAFVSINDLFNPSILNKLMLNEPDFNQEYLSKIKCETYIVAAEHDIMFLSDTVYLHENIKDSNIMIIKNADHCSYIENDGLKGYTLVTKYLLNK